MYVRDIAGELTKELIMERMEIFHRSLKKDFGIDNPRIAVFSLNPHAGDNGLLGTEEQEVIIPAMKEMIASWRAVLRAVSCRWFHGLRQLYAFRRYSGYVS